MLDLHEGILSEFAERGAKAISGDEVLDLGFSGTTEFWIRRTTMSDSLNPRARTATPKTPKELNASYYQANKERIKAARRARYAAKKEAAA